VFVAVLALVLLRPADDNALLAGVLGAAGLTLALVLAAGIRGHIHAARVDDEDPPSR
jgi:Na+-translocating ferredoxin:NAD+ oxidoreductase RnfA subunit